MVLMVWWMDDDVWIRRVGRRRYTCEEITLEGARCCIVTFTFTIGVIGIGNE